MNTQSRCEDCGAPATLSLKSVGISHPGQPPAASSEHRYCRPCAERRGVPPRVERPTREEPRHIHWNGFLEFLVMLESVPLDEPAHRASVRQAALEYRDFVQRAPEPAPPAVCEIIDRLLERTA